MPDICNAYVVLKCTLMYCCDFLECWSVPQFLYHLQNALSNIIIINAMYHSLQPIACIYAVIFQSS
jgi:hypothetical protein